MKDGPEKINRRRFLITATTVIGGGGLVALAIPFIKYMNPGAGAIAAGVPVDVDISKVEPGMMLTVRWRGRPLWVLRRTEEQLKVLQKPSLVKRLVDPDSQEAQQYGAEVVNWYRSLKPEYLVIVGICTHLGCVPLYRPDIVPMDLGPTWLGGFYCPCHGSRYDLSGRVFKNMPAPLNLPVVPYYFKSDTLIRVGELSDKSGQNWAPNTW
ncbi:ubiquinol-cytochrome c reductase iron-sulfur subunit [bacterium BMS3Bbin11]|nr:ubiquinol-cytochrome c reductase iron-sulfur subunit [bacterium BMS3Bbin11]GMT39352.1 MAG: ubiquinol-cytochrome c reductase iron-sulfur subunit [bacterium]